MQTKKSGGDEMKVYRTQERKRIKWQTLFFLDLETKLHYEKNRFEEKHNMHN